MAKAGVTLAYKAGAGAGHVTAGGSICIEALTLSGTAGSWTSQYNVESILNIVMLNMIGEILFLSALLLLRVREVL